jgi:hypothetical protein
MSYKVPIYTGEDLKWDTRRGVISNHYRYRAIGELKCPILILQWCKMPVGLKVQGFTHFLIQTALLPEGRVWAVSRRVDEGVAYCASSP